MGSVGSSNKTYYHYSTVVGAYVQVNGRIRKAYRSDCLMQRGKDYA